MMPEQAQQQLLIDGVDEASQKSQKPTKRTTEAIGRLDRDDALRQSVLALCRLKHGDVWEDPIRGHRVGVLDATVGDDVNRIMRGRRVHLVTNDPPYNVVVGNAKTANLSKTSVKQYIHFSRQWIANVTSVMERDAHLYVWLGTDYKDNFQPLPEFMIMMREFAELSPRNFITVRNQRGYGTQKNWMWTRQELLHYTHGKPDFRVVYTDIPKILRGYYKNVNGRLTENIERSKSKTIRPGNVWVDIQQVFYRLEENVPGCYAQKPLKAIERLMLTSSIEENVVLDCFAHSGTTLIAGERTGRIVYTFDLDPIFAEITIRRLEHYRKTGKTGWQWNNPFPELDQLG